MLPNIAPAVMTWTHTEIYPIRKWNHMSYWMKYELFGYGSKAWYPGNCPGDTSPARRQRPRSLEAAGGSPKLHLGTDVETGDMGRNWCALEASSKEATPSFRQCSEKCDFTWFYHTLHWNFEKELRGSRLLSFLCCKGFGADSIDGNRLHPWVSLARVTHPRK